MEFSKQEYWSRLPFPPPGDLPDPGIKPGLLNFRQILYCLSHQGSLDRSRFVKIILSDATAIILHTVVKEFGVFLFSKINLSMTIK